MYFGPPCYGYALNCNFVGLDIHVPGDMTVIYEKAKCIGFIYRQ